MTNPDDDFNPADLHVQITYLSLTKHILVRIQHIPTGLIGVSETFTSERRGKAEAMADLRRQLARRHP